MNKKLLFIVLLFFSLSLPANIHNWWKNKKAVQYFKNNNYEQALQIYNDLIDKDPFNPVFNYNIGDILYRQNRYKDAQQAFKRAVDYAQKNLKLKEFSWYGAGNSAYQLKEWQQAIDMYEEVLKLNPDNERVRHNLRLAQEKLAEERLQDMQDKLDKQQDKHDNNKKDQDQQSGEDQQNQQNQSGDDSQDSSSSSCKNPSSDNNDQGDKQGQQNESQQGQTSQDKQESGMKEKNGSGQEKSDQQDSFDDKKSDDEKNSGELKKQSDQDSLNNDKDGDSEQGLDAESAQNGQDKKESLHDKAEKNLEENLQKNQKKLDDVASKVAEQGQDESSKNGDENDSVSPADQTKNMQRDEPDALEPVQEKENFAGDKKNLAPSLKNQLQDLYETKSSQDARLEDYYVDIMQKLEQQEENIQREVIKKRVSEKMVGQYGKNSW